jgi:RNA polymerase sigma-70 factor (ECF subfamily)
MNLKFATGGEAELEELINLYSEKLLRYAVSILYNHQDAEDVVQDVFISAYKNRGQFDGSNLSAWLYKITYNLSLNKRKRRKFLFFGDLSINAMPSYIQDFTSADSTLEVLAGLNIQDRALVYGRVVDGYSYEQLSEILGRTPVALRKQYERVKKKIASQLVDAGKEQAYERA